MESQPGELIVGNTHKIPHIEVHVLKAILRASLRATKPERIRGAKIPSLFRSFPSFGLPN
jgi:hypothetical protein